MNLTYPTKRQVDHISENIGNRPDLTLNTDIMWIISKNHEDYQNSLDRMHFMQGLIAKNYQKETVWLLNMNHAYTLGKMASSDDILFDHTKDSSVPVINTSRGGKVTYHGPGQRICYMMIDIKKRNIDIKQYVWMMEEIVIRTLRNFSVKGFRKEGLRGVFVAMPETGAHKKISALGVNVSKGITVHGFALNNTVDLNFFQKIVPCGIKEFGVTSLKEYGVHVNDDTLDLMIQTAFYSVFD